MSDTMFEEIKARHADNEERFEHWESPTWEQQCRCEAWEDKQFLIEMLEELKTKLLNQQNSNRKLLDPTGLLLPQLEAEK